MQKRVNLYSVKKKKESSIQFSVWQQSALNENKITHYILVVNIGAFPLSNMVLFHKKVTSIITGWQTVIHWEVDMKCCWGQSSIVNVSFLTVPRSNLNYPHTPHLPPSVSAPCLKFKQLFCFVERASGCLFSFLSFYFLPFFFRRISSCSS